MCSEFLTLAIKESENITSISVHGRERRLNQYADDTSVFLYATKQNFKNSLEVLNWFYQQSGHRRKTTPKYILHYMLWSKKSYKKKFNITRDNDHIVSH